MPFPCGVLGTYFFDGSSFTSATAIYLTSALTTPAPDGYYSQGGIYRLQSGGLLGPVVSCPACTIACGDPILGLGDTGKYTLQLQLGSTPGATVITFNVGAPGVEFAVPDMCTWFYEDAAGNPIAASEYSSLVGGYMEGVIGAKSGWPASWHWCSATGQPIRTDIGSPFTNTGIDYTYDASSGTFVNSGTTTIGPYDGIVLPATPGQSTVLDWNCTVPGGNNCCGHPPNTCGQPIPECVPGTLIAPNLPVGPNWNEAGNESRNAVMVVPSPPGVTNTVLTIEVEAPCSGTWWGLDIQCPEELTAIPSSVEAGITPVCDMVITTEYYHVPVDAWGNTNPNSFHNTGQGFLPGNGVVAAGQPKGTLGWHDWVFEDKYGVTPLPAGHYKMESPAGSGTYWDVEIGVRAYTTIVPGSGTAACPTCFDVAAYPPVGPIQDGLVQSMCECLPAVPCGSGISGSGGQGRYLIDMDLGSGTGAAFIRFNPASIPDRCEWTYDGITRSAHSSNTATNPSTGDGYLEGVIGNGGAPGVHSCSGSSITNAAGSSGATYSGTIYTYDAAIPGFVNTLIPVTMGPYTAIGTGNMGTTLTNGGPSTSLMVIPKPNAGPQVVNIVIDGPCGSTAWSFISICPDDLPGNPVQTVTGNCSAYDATMYFADVSSGSPHFSTTIGLNDWVFNDPNGATPFAAGTWPVDNNGTAQCITVTNYPGGSIVTAIVACGGSC